MAEQEMDFPSLFSEWAISPLEYKAEQEKIQLDCTAQALAKMDDIGIGPIVQDDIDGLIVRDIASHDNGVLLSDVSPIAIEWLWNGYLPLGKLVLLTGVAKVGKSFFMSDIMARVSRGGLWPNGEICDERGVVSINYEDSPSDTLVTRLIDAGANLTRIRSLATVKDTATKVNGVASERPFQFPMDMNRLERAILNVGAALVVIDPIAACYKNFENNTGVRTDVITPLTALAERLGVCIVLVNHFKKGKFNEDNVRSAIAGARSWNDGVRHSLAITPDKERDNIANLTTIGTNLCKEAPMLSYEIVSNGSGKTYVQYVVNVVHSPIRNLIQDTINADVTLLWKRIMVLLYVRDRPMSPHEIAQQLAIPYNSISPTLSRMIDNELIIKSGRGMYDLPEELKKKENPHQEIQEIAEPQ